MDLNRRLKEVVKKDKQLNPKYIENVIKSDFYYLINNYFEVDFDDIFIKIETENDKYSINAECLGERMKIVRTLP